MRIARAYFAEVQRLWDLLPLRGKVIALVILIPLESVIVLLMWSALKSLWGLS